MNATTVKKANWSTAIRIGKMTAKALSVALAIAAGLMMFAG